MTLLYIISTPPVYNRLQAELDKAFDSGHISQPIKDSEARRLPYLQAVITEGVRIFPAATPPLFKIVPEEGDTVSGFRIPGGTQIGHNIFGTLRSKKYWGDDADLFRPERWLEADEPELERMNTVFEIIFGFGKYKCLGRAMASMELNKVIPEVRPSGSNMFCGQK
jgi:cytochrome P450